MSDAFAHVTIRILEKEYHVACPAEEKAALVESAELLNTKMREIRDSGKVVGLDRVAVMAALNLANELIRTQGQDEELEEHRRASNPCDARAFGLELSDPRSSSLYNPAWCSLQCSTRTKVSRTLNHASGVSSVGGVVQIRSNRKAFSRHDVPHLLLRFESNGS